MSLYITCGISSKQQVIIPGCLLVKSAFFMVKPTINPRSHWGFSLSPRQPWWSRDSFSPWACGWMWRPTRHGHGRVFFPPKVAIYPPKMGRFNHRKTGLTVWNWGWAAKYWAIEDDFLRWEIFRIWSSLWVPCYFNSVRFGCNAWCLLATNTVTRLARIIEYHRAPVTSSKKDHPKVGVNSCSFTTHRMLNTLW